MIKSKKDLRYFLECDRIALDIKGNKIKSFFFNDIWKFQRLLRKCEYYNNCRKDLLGRLILIYFKIKKKTIGLKLGFTIPINVFGPGLSIAHTGTIVVNGGSKIGANCRLHICVNIGTKAGETNSAPKIGDNVYIGPGAKIYGDITIADNISIGANSVVNKTVTEKGISIAGIPAKKISNKGSAEILVKATEIYESKNKGSSNF